MIRRIVYGARAFLLCTTAVALGGCGWLFGDEGMFRDRSDDYRQARSDEPLEVPRELDEDAIDDGYMIPRIADATPPRGKFELPRPEPLDENLEQETVTIQKLGEQRWILVEATPGEIWPRIRGFLNGLRIPVTRADASAGLIETGWLKPSVETLPSERYRLRIEQGIQRGSSEVYVLHSTRTGDWPEQSASVERENLMVQELAQYFADSAAASSVSMVAERAIESSGRAFLKSGAGGDAWLWLQLPFERAWASLGAGLEKSGFAITDLNRSAGTYYVDYSPPQDDDEPGFWASLFSWGDDEEIEAQPFVIQMRERDDDVGGVAVTISAPDTDMEAEQRERLLKRIKNFLT